MGILDKVTSLLPWRNEQGEQMSERREASSTRDDVLALRDEFDRWLQEIVGESREGPPLAGFGWMPAVNMTETEDEVVVTAEVPGLDRGDIELTITPEGLVIRGEKRAERQEKRRDVHVSEVRYGAFARTVPLPPGLDVDRAAARVANGVLTVSFPKAASRAGTRRIPVRT